MLDAAEKEFLDHMQRWGSDAYPLQKVSRGWVWNEAFGIKGAPVVYKTKREARQAIERYIDALLDKNAGRIE